MLLEVQVHLLLKSYLRENREISWPHHLTMARLVARSLRTNTSSLIQTGTEVERYSLSYLIPALLTRETLLIVTPDSLQETILEKEIPQLQQWLNTTKRVIKGDCLTDYRYFQGIILVSPQIWLGDRLKKLNYLPQSIPTIIIQGEELETWTRQQLTLNLTIDDWFNQSQLANTTHQEAITSIRVKITQNLYQHPPNPYDCYSLDESIQTELNSLWVNLEAHGELSPVFAQFWRQLQQKDQIIWASLERNTGHFQLYIAPNSVAEYLNPIWTKQTVIVMGQFLDREMEASIYRNNIGLEKILPISFAPDRHRELIQLYAPERFPFPNTPEFQFALLLEIHQLIMLATQVNQEVVILVDDSPLKAQIAANLAGEFGSRVQLETQNLTNNSILVSGWEFWCQQSSQLSLPKLMIIVTLPLPSLEHPVVASRVTYYRQKRQDWFRSYLLPTALKKMRQAIAPLRVNQGILVILDNRVNYRSYGNDILQALEPCARVNRLDVIDF